MLSRIRSQFLLALFLVAAFFVAMPAHGDDPKVVAKKITEYLLTNFKASLTPNVRQDAIDASFNSFGAMDAPGVALSIHESTLSSLASAQLGGGFGPAVIDIVPGGSLITVSYKGAMQILKMDVNVECDFFGDVAFVAKPSEDNPNEIVLGLAISDMKINIRKVAVTYLSNDVTLGLFKEVSGRLVNALLASVKDVLTHVSIKVPTLITTEIDLKQPKSESTALDIAIDPEVIPVKIDFGTIALAMNENRLFIVSQRLMKHVKNEKNVEMGRWVARLGEIIGRTIGDAKLDKQTALYVSDIFLDSVINGAVGDEKICATLKTSDDQPLPFSTKIPGPDYTAMKCEQNEECAQVTECRATSNCQRQVSRQECGGGGLLKKLSCEATKGVQNGLYDLDKLQCESRKSSDILACEAKKSTDKGLCESTKALGKEKCESIKEGMKRIAKLGNVAQVSSKDFAVGGDADICMSKVHMDASKMVLTAWLDARVDAHVGGTIKYTPLDAGHLLCVAPWSKSLEQGVKVPPQGREVTGKLSIPNNGGALHATLIVAPDIRIETAMHDLVGKIVNDAKFMIKCQIPALLGQIYEITPGRWLPRAASGFLDVKPPSPDFNSDLIGPPKKPSGYAVSKLNFKRVNNGTTASFTLTGATD